MYWKFHLADSRDLADIAELSQARDRNIGMILNKGGNAGFRYPMDADYAEQIHPHTSAIKAYRWNWRATKALRDGGQKGNVWDCLWTGYVATIDEDISGNSMVINSLGWLNRLDRRFIRRDKNYIYAAGVNTDDAEIIYDLLAEVNGIAAGEFDSGVATAAIQEVGGTYPVVWRAGSTPNTPTWMKRGTKLPNEGLGGSTGYQPAWRGKSYPKFQNVLSAFTDMTNVENGCDIHVDPITRELNIYRKRQIIRGNVVFGYNWGPANIAQLGRQIDGTTAVNYMLVTGRIGSTPKYQDEKVTSMPLFGPQEEVVSLSDVVDPIPGSTNAPGSVLWTYAAGEIALRSLGKVGYTLLPFQYSQENGVPEPFVDYGVGDRVSFTAKHAKRVNIQDQACRVFGMAVSIDDNGNEKLGQLQLTPGG